MKDFLLKSLSRILPAFVIKYIGNFFLFYFFAGASTAAGINLMIILRILYAAIPIIGIIFFHWTALSIVMLCFAECWIYGFYGTFKVLVGIKNSPAMQVSVLGRLFSIVGFWFNFIAGTFFSAIGCIFLLPQGNGEASLHIFLDAFISTAIVACIAFIMEGVHFFTDFIGKGEYKTVTPSSPGILNVESRKVLVLIAMPLTAGMIAGVFGQNAVQGSTFLNCIWVLLLLGLNRFFDWVAVPKE